MKSTTGIHKLRGRPKVGKTPIAAIRLPDLLRARIDEWISAQPKPHPSRSEAIRRLLEERLSQQAGRQSDASLDRQIAEQKAAIADMPAHTEPSPEAGMAAMDKALAENDLIDMKNKRTRRKSAKH
jgi:Arc/MetJ-type ribon-helix-helix transcriptional regulator